MFILCLTTQINYNIINLCHIIGEYNEISELFVYLQKRGNTPKIYEY
jgi:hypothetical protein